MKSEDLTDLGFTIWFIYTVIFVPQGNNIMPLPGGEADKLGNRYEGRWTVCRMIDVMDEKADYIELEKPGEDGFEFF